MSKLLVQTKLFWVSDEQSVGKNQNVLTFFLSLIRNGKLTPTIRVAQQHEDEGIGPFGTTDEVSNEDRDDMKGIIRNLRNEEQQRIGGGGVPYISRFDW